MTPKRIGPGQKIPPQPTVVSASDQIGAQAEPELVAGQGPLDTSTRQRAAGKLEPTARQQLIDVAAGALKRITEAVQSFHALDKVTRGPDSHNTYDGGQRPATLPRVLTRVTQDVAALREAAAHAQPGDAPRFASLFDAFLAIHVALTRAGLDGQRYEHEGAYMDTMKRLQSKLAEAWSLAPAFIGAGAHATLDRQWLAPLPPEYAPVFTAAQHIWQTAHTYLDPSACTSKDSPEAKAVATVRSSIDGAAVVREGGRYFVALTGYSPQRWVPNVGMRPTAEGEDVVAACRVLIARMKGDANVEIQLRHPGTTPARLEEAYSILRDAFTRRDFIKHPEGGDTYHQKRWSADIVELLPPQLPGINDYGSPKLNLRIYTNGPGYRDHTSYAEGTTNRLHADAEGYLARRGFGDVLISVEYARRTLTQDSAEAIVARLKAAAGLDLPASEQALEIMRTTGDPRRDAIRSVTIEEGRFGSGREVVVHAECDYRSLQSIEAAVREVLNDPGLVGTPVRIQTVGKQEYSSEQYSILFGHVEAQSTRESNWRRYQEHVQKPDANTARYATEHRGRRLTEFASKGPVHAELAATMKTGDIKDLDKAQLFANLEGYFLGIGNADGAWQAQLARLSPGDQARFLDLALYVASGDPGTPGGGNRARPLAEALKVMRRVEGRATFEQLVAMNSRQVPEHLEHSHDAFSGLGGPALALATALIEQARRPAL